MSDLNLYDKAVELAESGDYEQALAYLREHLQNSPDDVEALNDAGAILHCMGRSAEAVEHLKRARQLRPDSAEIIWNLAEAHLASGDIDQVAELFDEMEQQQIINPDILNRTAAAFLDRNDKAGAIETMLLSSKLWPDQQLLEPMLDVVRGKRPKIAFFCGGDGRLFLEDIVKFVEQRFPVRIFQGRTEQQLYELMQWCDIAWFEWCTNLPVIASKLPKVCKTIVRLHRYEAYIGWPRQVNWNNIDLLITVGNSFVKDAILETVPDIEERTRLVTIPNGVNLEKFRFIERPQGKNIAFLANLRMTKNPSLLLQCMQKLHYIDPEYRLFFAGRFDDPALKQYVMHMTEVLGLRDVVRFDGFQSDVNDWLADKHFIVSTSISESQGMGILEAMACGLKPVVHNFPGASEIFPEEFLFNISEEFCRQICDGPYEPRKYRQFVEQRYSLKSQLQRINELLKGFEADIDAQKDQHFVCNQS